MPVFAYALERLRRRQRVRYWAIAVPLIVIAIAAPFLRPLRHVDVTGISDEERVRLVVIDQLAHGQGFPLRVSAFSDGEPPLTVVTAADGDTLLPAQEPMLSVLGAAAWMLLELAGLHARPDDVVAVSVLTLLLATLPVAATTALIYRCARLLELGRLKRMAIAFASVACTGMLPYATFLNPYALAGLLITAAFASLAHTATARPPPAGLGHILLAGLLAGLGATVQPSVLPMAACLALVLLAMPWRKRFRLLSLSAFCLAAALPLTVHRAVLMQPYGGVWNVTPPPLAVELSAPPARDAQPATALSDDIEPASPPPDPASPSRLAMRTLSNLLGPFGLLTHAPLLLVALAGAGALLTRHWPRASRALTLACLAGFLAPFALYSLAPLAGQSPDWGGERFFAHQPLLPVSPLMCLWAGLFLRRGWIPVPPPKTSDTDPTPLWLPTTAYTLAAVSLLITLIGLLHPAPYRGFAPDTYPPYAIVKTTFFPPR